MEGTGATLIDTRKTIPTLRNLAKYASYIGGARNHRIRLDDGVLIKDNHIAAFGSITETIKTIKRKVPALTVIEIECDTLEQVREAVEAGADMILLDNMDVPELKRGGESRCGTRGARSLRRNRSGNDPRQGVDRRRLRFGRAHDSIGARGRYRTRLGSSDFAICRTREAASSTRRFARSPNRQRCHARYDFRPETQLFYFLPCIFG